MLIIILYLVKNLELNKHYRESQVYLICSFLFIIFKNQRLKLKLFLVPLSIVLKFSTVMKIFNFESLLHI